MDLPLTYGDHGGIVLHTHVEQSADIGGLDIGRHHAERTRRIMTDVEQRFTTQKPDASPLGIRLDGNRRVRGKGHRAAIGETQVTGIANGRDVIGTQPEK